MKLNYKTQLILAIGIVVICYVLTVIFHDLLFRTIGLCVSGLLYTIHPVAPEGEESNKELKKLIRMAGILLVCIGLFTTV